MITHKVFPRIALATVIGTSTLLAGCGGGKETQDESGDAKPAASAPSEDASGAATGTAPGAPEKAMGAGSTAGADAVVMGRRRAGPKRRAPGALGPSGAGASGASATGASATGGSGASIDGAQIEFASRTVDLGTIWDVGTRSFTFPFTNRGRERLVIESVKASCGCTATKLEKREFDSGEGAEIEVTFSPAGHGRQTKTIDIVSNSVQGRVVRLTIDADIRRFVTLEPDVINFPSVKLGEAHTAIVNVTSVDPDLVIAAVEATVTAGGPKGAGRMGSYLSARLLPDDPASTSPGSAGPRRHQVEVTLGKDAPWGASYGQLEIASRGTLPDGEVVDHIASMHVVATVFNEVHADDTLFRLAMLSPGTSFQRKIRLTRPSGAPFAIRSVNVTQSTMPGMSVRAVPIREGGISGYELVLGGNTGAFRGLVNGAVAIETDVAGEEQLEIRFSGMVRDINK